MRYIAGVILIVVILISINRLFFGDDIVGYSIVEESIDNDTILSPTPISTLTKETTATPTFSPSTTSTPVSDPTAIPIPTATPISIPTVTSTLVPTDTPIPTITATPIPVPTVTPSPTAIPIPTPLPTPDPGKYGPKLDALSISLLNDEITTTIVVDSYSSSVIESVIYIKNPFGEMISLGCSPFNLTNGVDICLSKFQVSEEFLSYKGRYSFERLFLKNSNNIQSNYWGDGRLQKGQEFTIENDAHLYLSTVVGFIKE